MAMQQCGQANYSIPSATTLSNVDKKSPTYDKYGKKDKMET